MDGSRAGGGASPRDAGANTYTPIHALCADAGTLPYPCINRPLHLGFLPATAKTKENRLRQMLVDKVAKFMVELGAGFSCVGKGLAIDVGGDEFEIDLLFYHVLLHRYIVIELKTGKFHPKDIGQLGYYMTAVDRHVKSEMDGKTIGILLCKSRNDIVAEHSLSDMNKPIGVSTYRPEAPISQTPRLPAAKANPLSALCALRLCVKIKHSDNSHFATPSIAIEI